MRTRPSWRTILFLLGALAGGAGGGFLALQPGGTIVGQEPVAHQPAASDSRHAADEQAIQANRGAYVKAFNAGDARGAASLWAADGDFTSLDGRKFKGRAAIEKDLAAFLGENNGLTLTVTPDSLRFVDANVALESGVTRVQRPQDRAESISNYEIVHVKRDGKWLLASVRELPHTPTSNSEYLRDLEWLVGKWSAQGGGARLEMTAEWTGGRNFLTRKYTARTPAGETKTGLQIIAWDPASGGIRSWVFDSDGGFGSELWAKDGPRWVVQATGVLRDGRQTETTNILTPVDADSFTWQSIQRSVNGSPMPDTTAVKVVRIKDKK